MNYCDVLENCFEGRQIDDVTQNKKSIKGEMFDF